MTVELTMPEVTVDKPNAHHLEMDKPQLRMVDLNLLTVFDAVMQEQNITRAAHALRDVAASRKQRRGAS